MPELSIIHLWPPVIYLLFDWQDPVWRSRWMIFADYMHFCWLNGGSHSKVPFWNVFCLNTDFFVFETSSVSYNHLYYKNSLQSIVQYNRLTRNSVFINRLYFYNTISYLCRWPLVKMAPHRSNGVGCHHYLHHLFNHTIRWTVKRFTKLFFKLKINKSCRKSKKSPGALYMMDWD